MKNNIEQRIQELNEKMDFIISSIKKEVQNINTDIVTNEQYCTIRTSKGMPLKKRALFMWFDRYEDCPRIDKHHVSVSKLDEWALNKFKPKRNKV